MVYARNLYIDFLAKFTLRALAAPDALSTNLRTELLISARFQSATCEPDLRQPALPYSIPPRAFTLFSRFFCISPHLSSTFSRARPVFKFCRFARSIRTGYERTCAQTPSLRVLFTRRCARILSKFYAEFQDCLHLNLRCRHKRSLLRARKRDLRDTAREMKFRRRLSKRVFAAAVRHKISKRQRAEI